jgi:hypothetical protein
MHAARLEEPKTHGARQYAEMIRTCFDPPIGIGIASGYPRFEVGLSVRSKVARVLIVDDEDNQVRALTIGLRLEGFEVGVARDAESALHVLKIERRSSPQTSLSWTS